MEFALRIIWLLQLVGLGYAGFAMLRCGNSFSIIADVQPPLFQSSGVPNLDVSKLSAQYELPITTTLERIFLVTKSLPYNRPRTDIRVHYVIVDRLPPSIKNCELVVGGRSASNMSNDLAHPPMDWPPSPCSASSIRKEDLVHEIFSVGPNFKKANNFLWPFKLSNPWRVKYLTCSTHSYQLSVTFVMLVIVSLSNLLLVFVVLFAVVICTCALRCACGRLVASKGCDSRYCKHSSTSLSSARFSSPTQKFSTHLDHAYTPSTTTTKKPSIHKKRASSHEPFEAKI
ncbi:hypothetical protein PRIPAC_81172 [Pristionchus pacificus]|uniref:Uncharacterized protein n=1 Tax=Pristionchus pacificus TaxID=54126 RepID=A0A2A6C371_PRIPA|nr:hypothetical protein PRIPAC_81172 [Pristionchus pacificus]|eukprot:PDM72471.1 hypothetical protein PRIPAC_38905 [Pristionchus pacificus]